jgi:hypothetical protein
MARKLVLVAVAAGVLLGSGCRHSKKRCDTCGPSDGMLGAPDPGSRIPPPSIPSSPSDLPETRFRFDPSLPPASVPSSPPRSGRPELLLPESPPPGLGSEITTERRPPGSTRGFLEAPLPPGDATDLPPRSGDPAPRSLTGLAGYATVPNYDRVATGRRPTLDGFDTLRANGFRTVAYLHGSGANVTAARDLAEKRGLRFVPIEVTPATLRAALDQFTAVVTDRGARPVYVADEDGVRSGALWYLVFRTTDLLGDDAARLRATPLGLSEATTEEQKQFWLAIQSLLAKR